MNDNNIINGDCIEELKKLPDNSVDAIITDPPYGLEFMGKDWDKFKNAENIGGGTMGNRNTPYQRGDKTPPAYYIWTLEQKNEFQIFSMNWAKECLRVLKPGGYLLSFGGTRTYHRMACGIEDAGFEIRDTIMWVYGSGFPKSLNIGKQIDKIQGTERKIVGNYADGNERHNSKKGKEYDTEFITGFKENRIKDKGNSEWEGWGTALKPAVEPIVVARKPLSEKNVALNVLKWGTGGINIDECRIGFKGKEDIEEYDFNRKGATERSTLEIGDKITEDKVYDGGWKKASTPDLPNGRFPANLIHDGSDEVVGLFPNCKGWSSQKHNSFNPYGGNALNKSNSIREGEYEGYNDSGSAARFFYCAKASKSERNYGCEELELKEVSINQPHNSKNLEERYAMKFKNNHPTVKPIALMEYLIKLVSKENAVILDPFLGSGTTAIACLKLNRRFIGIEKEPEYVKIAQARIKPYLEQRKLLLEEKQDD